jgi:hypothetical protein
MVERAPGFLFDGETEVEQESSPLNPEPKVVGFAPFKLGEPYSPSYYRPTRGIDVSLADCDIGDVISAFRLNYNLGAAVGYIVRAGRKHPGTKIRDLTKALEVIQREILLEGE